MKTVANDKQSMSKRVVKLVKRSVPVRIVAITELRTKKALKIYYRLLDKYGPDSVIYVQHYPGTGDIYLACSMFRKFTELEGTSATAVMTVIGGAGKRVADMFGLPRVEVLSQQETDLLVRLAMFMGDDFSQIKVTHYHPIKMTTGILDRMCSFKGTDFLSMYLDTAFCGVNREDMEAPCQPANTAMVDSIFRENNLHPGKTVVLSPYANTSSFLGGKFWERIALDLQSRGYDVCTNSSGPAEPAINYTVPVCPAFADIPAFLEKAGCLIALRSGLCEIAMTAHCKQIILYPSPNSFRFGVGDLRDFFSFANMGIREDCIEITCKLNKQKRGRMKDAHKVMAVFDELMEGSSLEGKEISS